MVAAELHHVTGLNHNPANHIEKQLIQAVCLQKMAKTVQGCFMRHRICNEVDVCGILYGIGCPIWYPLVQDRTG